jgi:hypothetical protein
LRKIITTRGSFPTDEAALKLLFLAIRNAGLHWRPPLEWTVAMGQFAILFGDRFEPSARRGLKTMRHLLTHRSGYSRFPWRTTVEPAAISIRRQLGCSRLVKFH